ncbi:MULTISPECIES: RluA family pseudouridine synthase [unclassified Moraxella]|uniref:RluA family pseudouridine synthase n=1 Tax=unclassified Moraxella TaxID=2685852 RepID=UPI003AF4CB48
MTDQPQKPNRPLYNPNKSFNKSPSASKSTRPKSDKKSDKPISKQPQSADEDILDFSKVNYLTVTRQQHDQRIDNFLLARLKGLPRSHVYNMIRSDEIRVNGKRCKPHDKLERNDIVRIAPIKLATRERPVISQEFAQGLLERIVYEDEGLIVLNKPAGMAVHGGSGEAFGVIEAMREATGKKYLELVHRIDKDTSGLLMIAKKRSTLKALQEHLREKTLQKTYLALVDGWITKASQTIDKPLLKYNLASGERRVKVSDTEDAKPSQTQVKVLQKFEITDSEGKSKKVSLIEAKPLTGRTHQIRVHLASVGHPLLGDDKYNKGVKSDEKFGVRRLALHAYQLEIPEYDVIKVELPDDMQTLIKVE